MSIDFLFELERSIDGGKVFFACPGAVAKSWVIAKSLDDLRKVAQRAADSKKLPVHVVKLIPKSDTMQGDMYLVPTRIDPLGSRGEPVVAWSTVETREAAEMMRDVRHGQSPYFGMQVEETLNPIAAAGV